MADILKIAEQLNSDVTRLNNERSRLEGMRESALASYEKAIKAYEEKYGVKLDESNIQAEYNNVFAHTKGAILDLQEKVESIKRGDYKSEDTAVEFDLEPNVEPIRATVEEPVKTVEDDVKAEETPAPKKRGRKPKAATQVVEPETLAVPEEIAPKKDEEIEIPQGPLNLNLDFNNMVVSLKVSNVPMTVEAYNLLAKKCDYPLHIGVTEAGTYRMGLIKSGMGIGALLMDGIGDTLRVSLTDSPLKEIPAGFDILRASGIKVPGPEIISCPTCGRTNLDVAAIATKVEERLKNGRRII